MRSRQVANDPGSLQHREPDGIDFVGNSEISSFRQNPPATVTFIDHRQRAKSNTRVALLRLAMKPILARPVKYSNIC